MKRLPPVICAICLLAPLGLSAAMPYTPPRKSVSASGEFIIYCDDLSMRLAVSTYCEDTKAGIQDCLGLTEPAQRERWKIPIVINLLQPDAVLANQPPSRILVQPVEGGSRRIEVDVILKGNLADIHFQQLIAHAILLEMEYRDKPPWKDGETIIDPPEWLVEGLAAYLRSRNSDVDVDVYKTLLANSDMPLLRDFLAQTTAGMNEASLKLYQAYSLSFLQLLTGLQGGQKQLCQYVADLPMGQDAPTQDLMKHFPALGGSAESLEKWWTLSMARLAASDHYNGLSLEESDQRLTDLLKFKIPTGKDGKTTKDYEINDFKEIVKNPQAPPVLVAANGSLEYLATQANPLFRPIIAEYMVIIGELEARKISHTAEELKNVAQYRAQVLKRMDEIADYLNWFEATQISKRSNSFDDYLRTVKEFSTQNSKRNNAISRYLDSLEIEMQ